MRAGPGEETAAYRLVRLSTEPPVHEPERKASMAWAMRMPTLRRMKAPTIAENMGRSCTMTPLSNDNIKRGQRLHSQNDSAVRQRFREQLMVFGHSARLATYGTPKRGTEASGNIFIPQRISSQPSQLLPPWD
jgi:hypothetical protein